MIQGLDFLNNFSIACLYLTLFLIFHRVRSASDIVEDTCEKIVAGDPKVGLDFLVNSLESDPRSQTADFMELGLIALKLVQANVTSAIDYMDRLLKQPLEPPVKSAVSVCSGLYSGSAQNSKDTVPAYDAKRYDVVEAWVYGVLTDVGKCESQSWPTRPMAKPKADIDGLSRIELEILAVLTGT